MVPERKIPFSSRQFIRKMVRTMIITGLVFLVCLVILVGALLACSPGNPKPFLDESGKPLRGSISEKVFVEIGGVKQGMFLMGRNINNPVLLFVHGGPCLPEYFLAEQYPTGLEDHFTVCYWEQRGGGLSYNPDISLDTMTLEQLTSDAIDVSNYLRDRFSQEKIYLMAHSGGTAFAIQAAAKAPELYSAYIGISQITQQAESEKLAGLENLADFSLFPEFMAQGNTAHLLCEIRRLMAGDVALPPVTSIFGHYAEIWTQKNARQNDLILRLLRILAKAMPVQ